MLMPIASALVGVLPTYHQIGIWATVLLVVLRMLQGLAVGGEYGTATSFLSEYARTGRRGFATSWYIFSSLLGFLFVSLASTGLTHTMSEAALSSWGWRIGFLVAAPMGLIALFIRLRISESPDYVSVATRDMTSKAPLRETFTYRRPLLLAADVGTLHAVAFYMAFSYATSYIITVVHQSASITFEATVVSSCVGLLLLPLFRLCADRWGRRRVLFAWAAWCLVPAYPGFLLMSNGGAAGAFGGQIVLAVGVPIFLSTSVAVIAELFPVRVRATGASVAYNVSASAFGGTAPFIATLLVTTTGDSHSPAVYLIGASVMALVAISFIKTSQLHTGLPQAELGVEPEYDVL
jgi:MHS family proline/betaine transporter-like MFS transporter